MTRINVVPVHELCNKHLFAEWREMPRVVSSLRKSLNRKSKAFDMSEIPPEYVLGKGHVKFFFDKMQYLHNRHKELTDELLKRGYRINTVDSSIFQLVDDKWYNGYSPSVKDMELNRERIKDRMPRKPVWS